MIATSEEGSPWPSGPTHNPGRQAMMRVMAEKSAELLIRDAAGDDVAPVARLWEELGPFLSQGHVADQLRVHRSRASAGALVAERDGVVIGFAS